MRRWWSASVCPKCRIKVNQAAKAAKAATAAVTPLRISCTVRPALRRVGVSRGGIDPGIGRSPIGVGRVRPCRGSVGACVRLATVHIGRISA